MAPHAPDRLSLPPGLPAPADDGAASHLVGLRVPPIALLATDGRMVRLDRLDATARTVLYAYPRTGRPGEPTPTDDWDLIPGARGCTPQACDFRDHHADLLGLGAAVLGVSTQSSAYQREAAERLHLPFPLLSDQRLELARAMRLPTFDAGGRALLKRLTLIVRERRVEHCFYPVFPPDRHADEVLAWLGGNRL